MYGLLRQVANRIANRLVATTFTEWRDHVRGVRGTLSNVMSRWENALLARALTPGEINGRARASRG